MNCSNIFKKPNSGFSFNTRLKAKARDEVYFDHAKTFYCECDYTPNIKGSSGIVDPSNCGYKIKHLPDRGARIEWEHVTPASLFGHHRNSWSNHKHPDNCNYSSKSGRKCARSIDNEFKMMEADLHNLAPAIGELNADRSNTLYGIIEGEAREYGKCDFEVGNGDRSFEVTEPHDAIHGDIARIWLYMYMTYNGDKALPLEYEDLDMFCEWHEKDPVSDWELLRNDRIMNIQGNSNPYVDGSYAQCNEICAEINFQIDEI